MAAHVELKEPDPALLEGLDTKPASLGRAAADDALVAHVSDVLLSWCASVDEALSQPRVQPRAGEVRKSQHDPELIVQRMIWSVYQR